MANFTRGSVDIHYDDHGSGFPLLLIAPGGMRSAASFWERTPWKRLGHLPRGESVKPALQARQW